MTDAPEETVEAERPSTEQVLDYLADFARKSYVTLSMAEQYIERTQEMITQLMPQFPEGEQLTILHKVGKEILEGITELTQQGKNDEEEEDGN